jgi:hypothetical protein
MTPKASSAGSSEPAWTRVAANGLTTAEREEFARIAVTLRWVTSRRLALGEELRPSGLGRRSPPPGEAGQRRYWGGD